jgi:hypothetical protein
VLLLMETVQLVRGCVAEGSSMQHLCHSASSHISERITVLTSLRCALATFLAQVCSVLYILFFGRVTLNSYVFFLNHLMLFISINPFLFPSLI